ncbi:MAG: (R,R)-butanediol dehydrogenase / meso-butanediol dehydrogenase / diacetyl reductase [Frankiaceae bacterium]|nr:(R,R)-butanediol dehydrogenase / meso-butanediol dehydrogenase / diacetyl reductase [Frankiaceae bacterium]
MKAVRWHAARDVRVEEIADPESPPAGWVRLRVEACGICGTDVEEYLHGPVVLRGAPLVLGHEVAGVVEEVGPDTSFAIGQRVAVEGNLVCGRCPSCLRGEANLCRDNEQLGLQRDGGLAELMLAPEAVCAPIRSSVPPELAALAEPLSVAVRAVRRGRVSGATVAVVGAGPVGLLLAQVARLQGADRVVLVDPLASRRQLAVALGADEAVEPGAGGEYDVVFESAGNAAAVESSVLLTRRGGTTVLLGVTDQAVRLAMPDFLVAERTLLSSMSHVFDPDFTTAAELINEGKLTLEPLITDQVSLDRAVSDGLDALVASSADHVKVMVVNS